VPTSLSAATIDIITISTGKQAIPSNSRSTKHADSIRSIDASNRDSLIACCIGSATSLLSSVVIFSVLGHMAFSAQKPVSEVAKSGPGLAFLAYPEVVMQLPLAPVWAVLFFLMLIILGTDSQFCTVEAFVTGLVDEYAVYLRPRRRLFTLCVCVFSFLLGIPLVMEGGMYVFQLMDFFSASGFSLLTVVFCEIVGLSWIYGK
jgi:solute carrier family 6 GABA transporter-like protein 1